MFEWKTASNAIYLGDEETGGKGRQFKARFLVPGLVKYDYGVCLLTKENADKFIQDFVGCPVIIEHQDVTDENVKEIGAGDIFSVWFDEKDGYYWCNGIIRDKKALELINKGYSVSCQYVITEYSDNTTGALHNGNPYDKVIENGRPEHLAIVKNPRYEGAIIAVNAIMAENEAQWITIKPNGEEHKGRHLLIKDGETPSDAVRRVYGDKNQKTLFDTKEYKKTKEDFKKEDEEKQKKVEEYKKSAQKRQDNLEYLGVEDPDDLEDLSGEDITFEEWEEKRKDKKEQSQKESKKQDKSDDDNIPKAYSRSEKTKLLYKYKTGKISRDEWIKATEKLNASNSLIQSIKDKLYTAILDYFVELKASNEDKWITVHPHGKDSDDYRRLKIHDGESVEDAMHRNGWYEKRQAKETQKKTETKTEAKPEQKQPDKEEKGEQPKSEQDKSIDKYLTDKSDRGFFYQSKGTSTYTNGEKRAEVEEFGENGGKYRAVFYDGTRRKDIKAYWTKRGMEKAVREHLQGGANKETKALEAPKDLNEAETNYNEVLKRYNENDRKRWQSGLSNAEYHKAWDEAEKAKKELTTARREYAESIMANFEEVENNPYEERQQARRDRYEEMAYKTSVEASKAHQAFRDKMGVIPAGQPIHGARDARYRERAWDTLGKAVKLNEKADYYAQKAGSVGKAGISADDANAIAKLAQKYKSGVDSAEKRRIIDRVIDIHKRSKSDAPKTEDFSQYGFNVERNTDINRLQLKFDGKPDESTRAILKSHGFRWSPREGAWQRQLTGNAEYSLKRIKEELTANNAFVNEFKDALYTSIAEGIYNRLGELLAQNKSNNLKEKWITIKGNHILLKEGESIADAFKRVTGVSFTKANKYEKKDNHKPSKEYSEILTKVKENNQKEIKPEEIINQAVKTFSNKFSEEKLRGKINFADEYNSGIAKTKRQTFQLYSNEKGEYNRTRAEKHKEIINELFKNKDTAKPKNGEAPTFMILGGRGGSGKGNFGKEGKSCQVYNKKDYIVLDADAIKEMLKPPYNGYNAFEVHQESSDILTQALAKARREGLNVVWDGTMKTLSSVEKKLKPFMDSKYNIEMYYMHLPREKAAERAIGRFMEDENGRYVPLTELLKMKDNEANFDKLKKYASKWAFYNNDVPFGTDPVLIDKNY